jgi:UDPglucose--hexose-1-phosphate uridylyltransferase
MPEFRQNYATREWVIIAPERAQRPVSPSDNSLAIQDLNEPWYAACPFCPGNERLTGRELERLGGDEQWSMRCVQNKFSALSMDIEISRTTVGRFLSAGSHGHAEVIIESPLHNISPTNFDLSQMSALLDLYLRRMTDISMLPDIAILMLFRNHGKAAGTSLAHPHSQLIASPIIPPHLRDPIQKAMQHYDTWGSCVYCDILEEELTQRDRIITENEHAVAFCPYASRTPYEIRIYPRRHNASYTWMLPSEIAGHAEVLLKALRALSVLLGNPSYNLLLRTAPIGDEDVRYLHWYFVIVPRTSTPAGFEMGSGIYINPAPPESCAKELRSVIHGHPGS